MTEVVSVRMSSAHAQLRQSVARALAEALINGFSVARDEGRPLTDLQQIDVTTSAVMAFDHATEGCDNLVAEELVAAEVGNGVGGAGVRG